MGSKCPKGKRRFGFFRSHWFEWRIFNRNVFDSCVKSWQYFRTINTGWSKKNEATLYFPKYLENY